MKILTWNIRGMSSELKKRSLSNLVVDKKPEILLIQEFLIQRLWHDADFGYAFVGAEGASGGITTIWNKDFLSVEDVISTKVSFALEVTFLETFLLSS